MAETTTPQADLTPSPKGGLLAMIHPQTGDIFLARRGEGALARHLILEGYEPIGPRGQAAAAIIRAQAKAGA